MKERRSFSCVVGVSPVACGVRAARCQSRRVRSRVGVSRVSSCVVPLLGVSSCVVPLLGVSRVVRSACESRPFFLSFQTRWMTFFFVLY